MGPLSGDEVIDKEVPSQEKCQRTDNDNCDTVLNHLDCSDSDNGNVTSEKETIIQSSEHTNFSKVSCLSRLEELDISQNSIKTVPEAISDLKVVSILNLENNEICASQLVACELEKLVILRLTNNNINKLPENIINLKNLKVLDVSRNNLNVLPDGFGRLSNLLSLNVSGNKLSDLPKTFSDLRILNKVDLSNNCFEIVPMSLLDAHSIVYLNLSHNFLIEFDLKLSCVLNLSQIDLSFNKLEHVPFWLFEDHCFFLRYVNLSNNVRLAVNKCKTRDSGFRYLNTKSLKSLNFSDCSLSVESLYLLSRFRGLESLNIGNTNFKKQDKNFYWQIPFGTLTNSTLLKEIIISNVELSAFPEDIVRLKFLEILDLSGNFLCWLPDSLTALKTLKKLNFSRNELIELPENIGELGNIEELRLNSNKLCSLPQSFCKLKQLKILDLYDNCLETFLFEFQLFVYLESMDVELNYFDSAKVSLEQSDGSLQSLYNNLKIHLREVDNCQDRVNSGKIPPVIPCYEDECEDDAYQSQEEEEEKDKVNVNETESDFTDDEKENRNSAPLVSTVNTDNENWDVSDNGDSFDPNSTPRPSYLYYASVHSSTFKNNWDPSEIMLDNFCPADMHFKSAQARRKLHYSVHEGQFDDISDDDTETGGNVYGFLLA